MPSGSAIPPPSPTQAVPKTLGGYRATAYCNKFGPHSINGGGVTAGGTDLRDGKQHYVIAAGAGSGLKLGDKVKISPNPFGTEITFLVDDHGGAIVGRHIDIYVADCAAANKWGAKAVKLDKMPDSTPVGSKEGALGTNPGDVISAAVDPLVSVGKALANLVHIAEKFVEALFSSATWFRVGKVVVGVLVGLYGLTLIARPMMDKLPPIVPVPI